MKANDAPEKIWMDSEWVSHFDCKDCITENSIEYVRKDAFIEKALKFIKANVDRIVNNQCSVRVGYLDEEFKKYIEK